MASTAWLHELGQILDDFAEVFGARPSERGAELYVEALADLTTAELAAAAANVLRNHKRFFPTPAEIRAAVQQPEPVYLPPPEHRPFAADQRSLDEIAANRRRLAPLWGEVRRVANGGELRPFAAVLKDLGLEP